MDHVISYLSRRKAVPAGLWHHEVKQSYDPAAVFEEQLKKCGMGERNPSARFAGTSPFRGGFFVRSNSIGRMLRAKHVLPPPRLPAPKHRPSLKTERFQRGR